MKIQRPVGRTAKHNWRDDPPFVSRDYAGELKCEARSCPVNRMGFCAMVSAVIIGPDGMCRTFLKFERQPAAKPSANYCKICGAAIVAEIQPRGESKFVKWRHASGETFAHTPEPRDS